MGLSSAPADSCRAIKVFPYMCVWNVGRLEMQACKHFLCACVRGYVGVHVGVHVFVRVCVCIFHGPFPHLPQTQVLPTESLEISLHSILMQALI